MVCEKCGQEKTSSEMNLQAFQGKRCKRCYADYMKEYRKRTGSHIVLYALSPERYRARTTAYRALKHGKIVKQPCVCGETKVEMHHNDYSKPTEVEWLCTKCHNTLHRESSKIHRAKLFAIWQEKEALQKLQKIC